MSVVVTGFRRVHRGSTGAEREHYAMRDSSGSLTGGPGCINIGSMWWGDELL